VDIMVAQKLVQVSLPWMSILGLVATGSVGCNVKWREVFERIEFFHQSAARHRACQHFPSSEGKLN